MRDQEKSGIIWVFFFELFCVCWFNLLPFDAFQLNHFPWSRHRFSSFADFLHSPRFFHFPLAICISLYFFFRLNFFYVFVFIFLKPFHLISFYLALSISFALHKYLSTLLHVVYENAVALVVVVIFSDVVARRKENKV